MEKLGGEKYLKMADREIKYIMWVDKNN